MKNYIFPTLICSHGFASIDAFCQEKSNLSDRKWIRPAVEQNLRPYSEGIAAFNDEGLWDFEDINRNIITPHYEEAGDFQESPARLKKDSKWGVVNIKVERLSAINLNGLQPLKYINAQDISSISALNFDAAPDLNRIEINNAGIQSLILPAQNNVESISLYKCQKLEPDNAKLNAENTLKQIGIKDHTGCSATQAGILNFSNYTALTDIHVTYNYSGITGCNLSCCTKLINAYFFNSDLTSLNIAKCNSLMKLDMYDCHFEADALNNIIFNMLPERSDEQEDYSCRITYNPGAETCDQGIADRKNWIPTTNNI